MVVVVVVVVVVVSQVLPSWLVRSWARVMAKQ
jgi:hypothetical protein